MEKIKVAVMGATGLVGQHFIRMLADHPYFAIDTLGASSRSAGKAYADAVDWGVGGEIPHDLRGRTVVECSPEELLKRDCQVYFSALPASVSHELELALRAGGRFVLSNASSHRMDEDVPLLIPEVNHGHLALAELQKKRHGGAIICGTNCSISGTAMVMKPLMALGLSQVFVTTSQAMSGAGQKGLYAMDIAGNVIPFIRNEEEKMEAESRKLLATLDGGTLHDAGFDVNASCTRVPSREGHLESLVLEFSGSVSAQDVSDALRDFTSLPQELQLPCAPEKPIIVRSEENRPQPQLDVWAGQGRSAGMAVTVGRIRQKGKRVNLFLIVHNLVRGAAGNCILGAELAHKRGLF